MAIGIELINIGIVTGIYEFGERDIRLIILMRTLLSHCRANSLSSLASCCIVHGISFVE